MQGAAARGPRPAARPPRTALGGGCRGPGRPLGGWIKCASSQSRSFILNKGTGNKTGGKGRWLLPRSPPPGREEREGPRAAPETPSARCGAVRCGRLCRLPGGGSARIGTRSCAVPAAGGVGGTGARGRGRLDDGESAPGLPAGTRPSRPPGPLEGRGAARTREALPAGAPGRAGGEGTGPAAVTALGAAQRSPRDRAARAASGRSDTHVGRASGGQMWRPPAPRTGSRALPGRARPRGPPPS